ncbi:tripartite tricarboxylate transporter TctB family protein [Lacibacterium aquatile]|uniref:Tripartite tricarboxylate transporter TctB family protein n=1 Tax=Lacibacterium aquatile TaxID=1168082 RepID=A0ABW5E026_9PROT
MLLKIKGQQDFWIGIIFAVSGLAGLAIARGYAFGTAGRMGPGYFPTVISALLILLGLISIARGMVQDSAPIAPFNWKALSLITVSVLAFGWLLQGAGLIVALIVLTLVSAVASVRFRLGWKPVLGLVLLVVFCVAVFVKGLGVPMPLVGDWFTGLVPGFGA